MRRRRLHEAFRRVDSLEDSAELASPPRRVARLTRALEREVHDRFARIASSRPIDEQLGVRLREISPPIDAIDQILHYASIAR